MKKNKNVEDVISEKEYTFRMRNASSSPQSDSPGDSEFDTRSEIQMGLYYAPDRTKDLNSEADGPVSVSSDSPDKRQRPKVVKKKFEDIPEGAKVISSELPSPLRDLDQSSDTH